jgi:hypothetical protein
VQNLEAGISIPIRVHGRIGLLETCTPKWKTSRPVLPCLADRRQLPKSATTQSLKFVCSVFCELRLDGVLGSCPSSPTGRHREEKESADYEYGKRPTRAEQTFTYEARWA